MPYKSKADYNRSQALLRRARMTKQRDEILELLGNKCVQCGYSDVRALAIDHVNGGGSQERKKIGGGYYSAVLSKLKAGSKEYQILCCNCNHIKSIEEQRHKKY